MKKILTIMSVVSVLINFLVVPVCASVRGPVYNLPVLNACDYDGGHYLIRGNFSTNGIIDFSQTEMVYISPSMSGYNYTNDGYIYVYKTTTGQTYIPYDDGYTNQTVSHYPSACSTRH